MLVACREVETGNMERKIDEDKLSGAFTAALIDVLNSTRAYQLSRIIFAGTESNEFSLSTTKDNKGANCRCTRTRNLNDHFYIPDQSANEQPSYGSVEYSDEDREWRIDLGFSRHSADQKKAPAKVKVYPLKKETEAVDTKVKIPTLLCDPGFFFFI